MSIKKIALAAFVTLGISFAAAVAIAQANDEPAADDRPTTTVEQFKSYQWDNSQQGRALDLSQYKRTFNDDFKTMDVVKDSTQAGEPGVWYAPGHTPFGVGHLGLPGPEGPFSIVDEGLKIQVEKKERTGQWQGACMQTVNRYGEGFAQKYGYFEMTARYDYMRNSQLWGAFWLKSQEDYTDKTRTRAEIDINEFYGDRGYHATVHLWPAARRRTNATITKHIQASAFKQSHYNRHLFEDKMEDGLLKGFHTYGGEITPKWVIIYFDRKEVGRFPTVEEYKRPMYMLVDIVSRDKNSPFPFGMTVKNVSAYLPIIPYEEQ